MGLGHKKCLLYYPGQQSLVVGQKDYKNGTEKSGNDNMIAAHVHTVKSQEMPWQNIGVAQRLACLCPVGCSVESAMHRRWVKCLLQVELLKG